MSHTIKDVMDAYAIIHINHVVGIIWVYINHGDVFAEYRMDLDTGAIDSKKDRSFAGVYHEVNCYSKHYTIVLYDQENFMRHFGMHFMNF